MLFVMKMVNFMTRVLYKVQFSSAPTKPHAFKKFAWTSRKHGDCNGEGEVARVNNADQADEIC